MSHLLILKTSITGVFFIGLILIVQSCKKEQVPTITTTAVSNIAATTATGGGNITNEGSSTVTTRGVCWSTGTTPTIADNKTTNGAGAGSFSSNIVDLFGGTTYFIRAYARNSTGTGYGMALSFNTTGQPPGAPSATIQNATNIQLYSAQLNGNVNANYYSTVVTFEYGTTISYGSTITATQSPVTGGTDINASANISGLTVGTTYHYRLKAVNSLGTTYSSDMNFATLGGVPTVTIKTATNITTVSAKLNAIVNANYFSSDVTFEYGTTTSYGSTITATQSPVTGKTDINVSANISGLTVNTTYHYRIKAVNSIGTTYSSDSTFTTLGIVADVDGNVYYTTTIGTQVWMTENLKTTKYNDSTAIPNITDNTAWAALITGAYSDYNNTPANSNTYGRLYNWYAVDNNVTTMVLSNGGKNVCPTGWHVPTDVEWSTLTTYLGGASVAGGKLMETGTTHWKSLNAGATNETEFTALPGGFRSTSGTYFNIGYGGYWQSSTEYSTTTAYSRDMYSGDTYVLRSYYYKGQGISVRCLRDF